MPFRSEKQRRFLWRNHPDIARRWAHEYPGQHDLPMYASKKKKKHHHSFKEWLEERELNEATEVTIMMDLGSADPQNNWQVQDYRSKQVLMKGLPREAAIQWAKDNGYKIINVGRPLWPED